jgi:hypothetical protein
VLRTGTAGRTAHEDRHCRWQRSTYRNSIGDLSVIERFSDRLLAKCFQHKQRAEANSAADDNSPERKATETWQHAPWEQRFVGIQYFITAT